LRAPGAGCPGPPPARRGHARGHAHDAIAAPARGIRWARGQWQTGCRRSRAGAR